MMRKTTRNGDGFSAREALQKGLAWNEYQTCQPLNQEGVITGVEALARAMDSNGNTVPPNILLNSALHEGENVLRQLHRVLTQQALNFASETGVPVNINVHPAVLRQPDIVEELMDDIDSIQLDQTRIILEILESTDDRALVDSQENLKKIAGKKPLRSGKTVCFDLAVDDYPEENSGNVLRTLRGIAETDHLGIKIGHPLVHALKNADPRGRQEAVKKTTRAIRQGRTLKQIVLEGIEPGEESFRNRLHGIIHQVLPTGKILAQVGKPENHHNMKEILAGTRSVRAFSS